MFRKLLNPDANANNTLKLLKEDSGCCGGDYTTCKYRVEFSDLTTLTAITIEEGGANVVVACDTSDAADDAACLPIIRAALHGAGYLSDDTPGSVPKDVTLFTADNGDTFVEFWGEAKIVSLAVDAGTATDVQMCTSYVDCLYEITTPVGAIAWTVDGDAADSGTYNTGAAATLKADILASVPNAYGATVTEVSTNYVISFRAARAEIAFDTVLATRSDCKQNFKA
jgi:hypothetical protein